MKKIIVFFMFSILVIACKQENQMDANAILTKSIVISGGKKIDSSKIAFNFRDKGYVAVRNNGDFLLMRNSANGTDSIFDILSNEGFERRVNENVLELTDSMIPRYSASVNSVHYFSVLPYGLNSKSVNKSLLGTIKIKGTEYYKIQVTFNEEGGGEDFEDVFVYWVNKKNFKVEYLAYSYAESKGTGFRFREAYNERYVMGIRFVDYNNYKPETNNIKLEQLDSLFESNALKLLSKIELDNIQVDFNF